MSLFDTVTVEVLAADFQTKHGRARSPADANHAAIASEKRSALKAFSPRRSCAPVTARRRW